MIKYIIIALLQGIFEWLPISSSGQTMIISTSLFGISPENAFSLSIWLHLGTSLAVLLRFRNDYINILKTIIFKDFREEVETKKRNWIIYATLGTGITAIPLYFVFKLLFIDYFTAFQGDIITLFVSGLLILTGVVIISTRKKKSGDFIIANTPNIKIYKDSFISGLFQGISILPGISRSGVTVSTILIKNYNHDNALRLSFLMSVPVTVASIIVDIVFGEGSVFGTLGILTILITTIISFLVGYVTIELLLRLTKKINFGYFCITYGVIAYIIIVPFFFLG
ncbi:MAG: undecaprenyl-diphosphate phosphatase [Promethearchaeota archaeon]|jgi:undecaprenyl-diphosphatase